MRRDDDVTLDRPRMWAEFADLDRVRQVVDELGPDEWQMHDIGQASRWTAMNEPDTGTDDAAEVTTALVDGACIFLNRPGFPAGAGCALHQHALLEGVQPLTTTPDVCWQLPIKRSYRSVERSDESAYTEVTIEEFDRGSGGRAAMISIGIAPRRPIGTPAYRLLAHMCDEVMATRSANGQAVSHPDGRRPLPLLVHLVTLASATAQTSSGPDD